MEKKSGTLLGTELTAAYSCTHYNKRNISWWSNCVKQHAFLIISQLAWYLCINMISTSVDAKSVDLVIRTGTVPLPWLVQV